MEEADSQGLQTRLVQNQPYDESLEINDSEEVASVHSPTPRKLVPVSSKRSSDKGKVMTDPNVSSEDEESTTGTKKKEPRSAPQQKLSDDDNTEDSEEEDEDDDDDDDEDDDDEEENGASGVGYDPADFEHLPVTPEIKELFQYITRYTPHAMDMEHKLKPFIPDFIPAVGDIDAFLKVPRSDNKPDKLGLLTLDEPSTKQSDPTVMALWLSENSKQHSVAQQQIKVKSLENAEKNHKAIDTWIESISELHRSKPPATVHYTRPMPEVETLMQEWPSEFEDCLGKISLPTAELDCDLPTYIDMVLAMLDIPVYKSRIQSLHVLFSLYSEFKNSQHFKALAEGKKERSSSGKTATPIADTEGVQYG